VGLGASLDVVVKRKIPGLAGSRTPNHPGLGVKSVTFQTDDWEGR